MYKVVELYFRTQLLELPRYLLVRDVPVQNIVNIIIAFSDGSAQFSTSAVYLLSMDSNSKKFCINLVSTLCKLAEKSKSKGEDIQLNTVPKKESHGLFLATNGAMILAQLLTKLKIPLNKVYVFSDAISHIIALRKTPSLYQAPFNRYYSQINTLLF